MDETYNAVFVLSKPLRFSAPAQEQPETVEVGSLEAEWRRWAEVGPLDAALIPLGLEYLQRGEP